MELQRLGDTVVFSAGRGEWYNQPHDRRWDMGECAQDLPPAAWHIELERALAAADPMPHAVIVDVAEMTWLVGEDWGFLVRLASRVREAATRLVVVARPRVTKAVTTLGLEHLIETGASVDEALQNTSA